MRMRRWTSIACVLGALAFARGASAESSPGTHDGFYLQLGLGPGYISTSASETVQGQSADASISGAAITGAFWIGGTPAPGLVIGGGTVGAVAPGPKLTIKQGGREYEGNANSDVKLNLSMLGAFVDYYPNPRDGFHLQGMVGYAMLTISNGSDTSDNNPDGLGLLAGVGYEWWVGDEWSIGLLGRCVFAPLSYEGVGWSTVVPGLLATFTYH